jgi:hypothetical protein
VAKLDFSIQYGNFGIPKNWKDLNLKMVFNSNNQPQIDIEEFILVNQQILPVQNHLEFNTMLDGMDLDIVMSDEVNQPLFLGGYLDLTTLKWDSPVQCRAKFKASNSLDLLDDRFKATSFAYLVEKGNITENDFINVPTMVQKKFDGTEVAFASLGLFIITKTILETYKDSSAKVLKASKILISGTGAPSEILEAIGTILYTLAYYTLLVIALINLLKTLKENFVPRKTNYKGIRLKTALTKACEFFGLTLDCDIEDLYNFVYLPSKTNPHVSRNKNDEGIPNVQDFGYNVSEMFQLAFDLFDAKFTIKNKVLYIRNNNSDFWRNQSSNIFPSHIDFEKHSYNTNELYANRLIRFQYDSSDEHTLPSINKHADDWSRGTNFQMITDFNNGGDNLSKMNKGFNEVSIPMSLGRRRTNLSTAEELMKQLFKGMDTLIKLLGGGTPFADTINLNKGCLLISQPAFNNAKLIYLDQTGYIPSNHRDKLSAEALYNNYYHLNSFKTSYDRAQKFIFNDVKIPMDYNKFRNYIDNPFFVVDTDASPYAGKYGKLLEISWSPSVDYAIVNIAIEQEYINHELLIETPITT